MLCSDSRVTIAVPQQREERSTQWHLLLQVRDEPGPAALRRAANEHAGGARDRIRQLHRDDDRAAAAYNVLLRHVNADPVIASRPAVQHDNVRSRKMRRQSLGHQASGDFGDSASRASGGCLCACLVCTVHCARAVLPPARELYKGRTAAELWRLGWRAAARLAGVASTLVASTLRPHRQCRRPPMLCVPHGTASWAPTHVACCRAWAPAATYIPLLCT